MSTNEMPISSTMRRAATVVAICAIAILTGCAQVPLGNPVASVDNIQAAKATGMKPVNVGVFKLETGKDPKLDASIAIRASTAVSPFDGSFASYLRETLATELKAAGLFDPASSVTIEGFLVDSQLDTAITQGSGSLAARFVVLRAGKPSYDKLLKVNATWDSSFVGAVAIPAARNEYSALYRKLVSALLADPAFRTAVAP